MMQLGSNYASIGPLSGFHHQVKRVTSMSPLQFQKHLRLQEARRLMLGDDLDAASAGFRVGYEDPSFFSGDYKKFFALRRSSTSRGCVTISKYEAA